MYVAGTTLSVHLGDVSSYGRLKMFVCGWDNTTDYQKRLLGVNYMYCGRYKKAVCLCGWDYAQGYVYMGPD